MSGILDKKSRVFDYVLTQEGLRQIQKNDLRYRYASVSDADIVYEKDYQKSEIYKNNIDQSRDFNLPLESSPGGAYTFSNEFKFDETTKEYSDKYLFNIDTNNFTDSEIDQIYLDKSDAIGIGSKIKNQKIILTKSGLSPVSLDFKITSNISENTFDFKNPLVVNKYPTILNGKTSVKNTKPILRDKRFSNKTNFMRLSPELVNGDKIFDEKVFFGQEEYEVLSNVDWMFKLFNEKINFNNPNDRESTIKDIVTVMSNSDNILRKEYEIIEEDNVDTFFIEMFESSTDENRNNVLLDKLLFIHLTGYYDSVDSNYKDVYLIGKLVYNNKEFDTRYDIMKMPDFLKKFNSAFNTPENYEGKILKLSNYYSFINMFVLVAE